MTLVACAGVYFGGGCESAFGPSHESPSLLDMPSMIAQQLLNKRLELELRNAAAYRPFRQMSPFQIADYFAARGHDEAFIDAALARILSTPAAPVRRKRKARSLRELMGR